MKWGQVCGAMLLLSGIAGVTVHAPAQGVMDRMKQKAREKMNQQVDRQVDQQTDAPEPADKPTNASQTTAKDSQDTAAAPAGNTEQAIRSYQNYDFVPGETTLFYDDFASTQDGEFPSQWELTAGQAVVNRVHGYPALLLTDGNYAVVEPRMTKKNYLPEQFTVEFDTYSVPGSYPVRIEMAQGEESAAVSISGGDISFSSNAVSLSAALPSSLSGEAFNNAWRHVAIVYRKPQLKVYVEQYRVLSVPDTKFAPEQLKVNGAAEQDKPLILKNFRLASGGGMNMIGQTFTEAKIVTHGINFDVDKATLRPESMGVLNQIKSLMTSNPAVKFEIDGHTDNSGTPAHNMTLSQQRAEAVKAQLLSMGVEGSRLTAKGYGDTKPLGPNTTPADKANNRRVEFVRQS